MITRNKKKTILTSYKSMIHAIARSNYFHILNYTYIVGAVFVYDSSRDSVLHVTQDDYNNCNTASPLHKLSDGRSSFHLDRSGPYYFISGVAENCRKNEKLVVVVMADRSSSHKPDDTASPPPPPPPEEETPSNRAAFATAGAFATLLGFSLVLVI